ncbi:MAG: GTPase [Desulfomonilia bacterium]|jgi:ribosome-interacting GTPase 1|uniref:GTPase Obg n=1 Tax=anaerobic digester metagenome TaxID=1263854 RepID=A0A485M5F5_9ZZZZ|nr:TGS domain-containing protein [Pseudomonadota bacterium]HON38288.1 TGS domain-containing protein [Deltaproteobacteria bacterium]HRS57130.1 TGS domain-containing protein [Desulfomonilia bacterium]HPD22278.1 TGS domain-containing protein [Deltaproteobacteria bacterium]HPX19359.1 TGS domain-containing protein [Deltaproteobacteria bacterium]
MPANLPPTYLEAERRYREAKTPQEKLDALEEMLAIIPKHKGTDKLQADLKRRIARHRDEAQKKKGAVVQKSIFHIDKEGAAQVVIVGPPNTGKSSLVDRLTKASPEIADFPHTTHKPTPGMAQYENIQFQLIDTPPLTGEYVDPAMADMIRRADVVVVLIDLTAEPLSQYEDTMAMLESFRIYPENAEVPDGVRRPVFLKKILLLANKMDTQREQDDFETFIELTGLSIPALGISVHHDRNLSQFLDSLYQLSGVIRVYSKNPGKEPDLDEPFVISRGSTLEDLAGKIHKDFVARLKYARIWGKTVHDGQMVQRDYELQDGDIVEIHI